MFELILSVIVFIIVALVIAFISAYMHDIPEDYKFPYPDDYYESESTNKELGGTEMGKMNDRMEGRNQGIVFALELARKGGIEALEKEVIARNISGLSMTMTQKEVEKTVRMMQFRSTTMGVAISLITLLDEFSMGKYQVRKFKETFDKKVEGIMAKDGDTSELLERIEKELDLRITFD